MASTDPNGALRDLLRPSIELVRRLVRRLDRVLYRWVSARVSCRQSLAATRPAIHFLVGSLGLGGTQRQIVALAAGLAARGFTCTVWVMDVTEGVFSRDLRKSGAEIRWVFGGADFVSSAFRKLDRFCGPAMLMLPAVALVRGLRRDRPVVLQAMLDATNVIGALSGRLAGVPVVSIGLRSLHPDARSWPSGSPWVGLYGLLRPESVDSLIANSQAGRASFLSHETWFPASKAHVVQNCLVVAPPGPVETHREGSLPVILWLARVAPEKRPDLFVKALARLRDAGTVFEAKVCGAGESLASMQSLVDEYGLTARVQFLGVVSEVANILEAATVMVHCSDVEGSPNAIIEAQLHGCPVVATAAGGVSEMIHDGETGLLVPCGDAEAIATCVTQLLSDRGLAERISSGARLQALRCLSADRAVDEMLEIYRQILRDRGDQVHHDLLRGSSDTR